MFIFDDKNSDFDPRVVFANNVCKIVVQKNGGDIDKSLNDIKGIYDGFEGNVRNIYQFIDSKIPLFALYDLKRHGADNFCMTEQEYEDAISRTNNACVSYYCF